MTPRDFIANFDTIAEAPNGITRLREFVLQLAVRGRLVPQNPADEPADRLIERATVKRTQSEKKKTGNKKSTPSSPDMKVPDSEDLASGWTWTCTATLGVLSPKNQVEDDTEVSFCPMPVIPTDYRESVVSETRRWGDIKKGYTHFAEGDIVVAKITPCFQNRKSCIMTGLEGGIGAGTTELHVVRPFTDAVVPKYLLLFYKSPDFLKNGVARMTGTAGQQRVPREYFAHTPLPLPPLAEQHRIVAKVDELMDLLDRLEEAQRRRETIRTASRDSALAALRAAGTIDEIKTAWMRIAVRTDELFITPADVPPLREAMIQLAIRGRLVAQDPEKVDSCSKQHFTEIQEQTQSFELPSGWTWSNLKLLGRVCGGGTPSKRNPEFWSGDIPWISPKDMKRELINQSQDMVTAKAIDSSSIKLVPSGALLMVVRGMILDHSFPVAVTEAEVTINQDMKALIPFDSRLSRYLLLLMKGMRVEILKLVKTSTHGTCRLPTDDLFSIPLPIPPVEVQQSIISKMDDVMNVLDQLSFRLTAQRSAHNAFATSFLQHLNT